MSYKNAISLFWMLNSVLLHCCWILAHYALGFSSSRNTWSIKVGIFGDAEAEKRANHTWLFHISCFSAFAESFSDGMYVCVHQGGQEGERGCARGGASAWQEQAQCWGMSVMDAARGPCCQADTPSPVLGLCWACSDLSWMLNAED